jgi:acetyltransferase-like isoleucine patch superfamily enzyme
MRILAAIALSALPSAVKVPIYRLLGMKIGKDVRIGFGAVLLCTKVDIADGASIGHLCLLRLHTLKMGKRSSILNLVRATLHTLDLRSQSSVRSQNEISGDRSDPNSVLYLGPASWILPHCFIDTSRPIRLGRNVGVGGGSYLFTHGYWLSKLDGFPVAYGDISIADDVWLPWGCFIMPNVTIGSRAVVGARSVLNRSIPAGALAAGVPAKVLREKSWIDLTVEDRAGILVEVSMALAVKRGVQCRIDSSDVADRHFVDDELVLVLHKDHGQPMSPSPVLNVVFGELDRREAERDVIWSLQDYTASPYARISEEARSWFAAGRAIGLRYYPVDEDFV